MHALKCICAPSIYYESSAQQTCDGVEAGAHVCPGCGKYLNDNVVTSSPGSKHLVVGERVNRLQDVKLQAILCDVEIQGS